MKTITETQKEMFIQDVSDCMNNQETFKSIQDCALAHLDLNLDNDDDVWHRIEESILNTIIEFKEENQ